VPSKEKPVVAPKAAYGKLKLNYWGSLFQLFPSKVPVKSVFPITFEELDQVNLFLLFRLINQVLFRRKVTWLTKQLLLAASLILL
jgi:hypothetical protein